MADKTFRQAYESNPLNYQQATSRNAILGAETTTAAGGIPVSEFSPKAMVLNTSSLPAYSTVQAHVVNGGIFVIEGPQGEKRYYTASVDPVSGVIRLSCVHGDTLYYYDVSASGSDTTWSERKIILQKILDISTLTPVPNADNVYFGWDKVLATYDSGNGIALAIAGDTKQVLNPITKTSSSCAFFLRAANKQYNVICAENALFSNAFTLSVTEKDYGDIDVVNLSAGSIGGDIILFTGASNAGKILDYGTVPADVTGIDFVIESNVHTMLICFKVAADSRLAYVNVCDHEFSTLPTSDNIFPNKGIPETFTPGNFYQLSFANGVVVGVEIEPNQANNSLGGNLLGSDNGGETA